MTIMRLRTKKLFVEIQLVSSQIITAHKQKSQQIYHFQLLNGDTKWWFEFQKVHYTYVSERKEFIALELDMNQPMSYFQDSKGLETDEAVMERKQELGDNKQVDFFGKRGGGYMKQLVGILTRIAYT